MSVLDNILSGEPDYCFGRFKAVNVRDTLVQRLGVSSSHATQLMVDAWVGGKVRMYTGSPIGERLTDKDYIRTSSGTVLYYIERR